MSIEAGAYVMSGAFWLLVVWVIWLAILMVQGPQPITRGRYLSIEQMRAAIIAAYSGPRWTNRVNSMQDKQVFATYNRLLDSGKLSNAA
ncbi:membrane protein [Arthrobacter phage Lewando]|nr:membrane protein [Arthrobacter phage Lewando]